MAEAEGAAGAVQGAGVNVGRGLAQKIGPLPLWGWLAVAGVGLGAYFLIIAPSQQGNQASSLDSLLPGMAGGGGGGGTSGGGTTTTTTTTATNQSWVLTASQSVATQLGLPLAEVESYLGDYINGFQPQGSNQAQTTFANVITAAQQSSGLPPQPIVGGNANPYTSTNQWIQAVLSFLPAGTSASVQNELINLANGSVTSISQDAATALQAAIGIVGQGPTPISYTITGTPGAFQTFTPPTLDWNSINATWGQLLQSGTAGTTQAYEGLFPGVPTAIADWVYATSHSYKNTTGNAPTTTQLQNWFNQAVNLYNQGLGVLPTPTIQGAPVVTHTPARS